MSPFGKRPRVLHQRMSLHIEARNVTYRNLKSEKSSFNGSIASLLPTLLLNIFK